MSQRDTILDALAVLLGGATVGTHTKPGSLTVSRHRTIPLDPSQLPHQALYMVTEEVMQTGPGRGLDNKRIAKRKLHFCVESRCVIGAAASADQAIDPLLSWSVQALCATQQLVAGMHDIEEEGTIWDQVENDYTLAGARQMFAVIYVTSASDPDALS